MRKFWNFISTEQDNVLRIDGYIAETSWFDDDVTPLQFASELKNVKGDLTVWLNSGGGDCFAASQIYTMLKEHDGKITIKVDGIAVSAASVIAMAGDEVLMAPTALMMIHNPASFIFGEVTDLEQGIEMLSEIKESIINSYVLKTGLPRTKISRLMDNETWFNANKAIEMGFADGMLYKSGETQESDETAPVIWNSRSMVLATVNAMRKKLPKKQYVPERSPDGSSASGICGANVLTAQAAGISIESLEKRLNLIKP